MISTYNNTLKDSRQSATVLTSQTSDQKLLENRIVPCKESSEIAFKDSQYMNSDNKNKVHLNGLTFDLSRNPAYPQGRADVLAKN